MTGLGTLVNMAAILIGSGIGLLKGYDVESAIIYEGK